MVVGEYMGKIAGHSVDFSFSARTLTQSPSMDLTAALTTSNLDTNSIHASEVE